MQFLNNCLEITTFKTVKLLCFFYVYFEVRVKFEVFIAVTVKSNIL
jgi:hypothetical protein